MAITSGFKRVVVIGVAIFGLMVALAFNSFIPEAAQAAETSPGAEIKGKVTAKTDSALTLLMDGGRQYTFGVNGDTQFIQDGKAAKFSDLKVGMLIALLVKYNPQAHKYMAVRVYLPKAEPPTQTCKTSSTMEATVAEKMTDRFTVKWTNGELGKVAFKVTSQTKFFHNGHPSSYADLKAGQSIHFIVQACQDGSYTATQVYF